MATRTYSIINNTVGAGDVDLTNRFLNITGAPSMEFLKISGYTATAAVAETLQVSTVAFTAANSTSYRFFLSQTVANGIVKALIVNYISDSTATAAEINAAFTAQINAMGFQITPSGAGTPLTLTAKTGYPIFTISQIENTTVATGTAGVAAKGTAVAAAALVAGDFNTYTDLFVSGNTYTQYQFTFGRIDIPSFDIIGRNSVGYIHNLFVYDGDAQYAAFNTALTNLMSGGTEADATLGNVEVVGLV